MELALRLLEERVVPRVVRGPRQVEQRDEESRQPLGPPVVRARRLQRLDGEPIAGPHHVEHAARRVDVSHQRDERQPLRDVLGLDE